MRNVAAAAASIGVSLILRLSSGVSAHGATSSSDHGFGCFFSLRFAFISTQISSPRARGNTMHRGG